MPNFVKIEDYQPSDVPREQKSLDTVHVPRNHKRFFQCLEQTTTYAGALSHPWRNYPDVRETSKSFSKMTPEASNIERGFPVALTGHLGVHL